MPKTNLLWRLEGGYSRFLEGSRIELQLEEGPLRQTLNLSPLGLARRTQPLELTFRAAKSLGGEIPGKVRWRIRPEASFRARVLFGGNPFLGNFRVPKHHFAVQWDVQVSAEGSTGKPISSALVFIEAGTRWHQTWVQSFPEELPIHHGLEEGWKAYRNLFDPEDVLQLAESQIVQWSWSGRIHLDVSVEWGVGAAWIIPGKVPFVDLKKQIGADGGLAARFRISEEGQFALRARRQKESLSVSLRRFHEKGKAFTLSAGLAVPKPIHIDSIGFKQPKALQWISNAITAPLANQVNDRLEQALIRRMEIALVIERAHWKRNAAILHAAWPQPETSGFVTSYSSILAGRIPDPMEGLTLSGRLSQINGKRLTVNFNVLNLVRVSQSKERRTEHALIVSPDGEIVIEESQVLEKSSYRWDELQFLKLIHHESTAASDPRGGFTWTYGREEKFSHEELRRELRIGLHCHILPQFSLPPSSAFPIRARLLLASRFSEKGLAEVKGAGPVRKWAALIQALELADPPRYGERTFWRDWIDVPEVRKGVDLNPVQAHLVSQYPVRGRTDFERIQVVTAYRKAKRFLNLMEQWKQGEYQELFKAFNLGMDVPVFIVFHLLCPAKFRVSAGLLTGDLEQTWGDPSVLDA